MTSDRVHLPDFRLLTWRNVDPVTRPDFDPAGAAALVRSLPPAAEVPPAGTDWRLADFWWDRMTEALVERLGDWAVGWQHTVVMEDYPGRGVIPVWWNVELTITTPAETLNRLADALVAWHELTVELATDAHGRFAAAAPATTDSTGDPAAWRAVKAPGIGRFKPGHFTRSVAHPASLSWADVDPRDRLLGAGVELDEVRPILTIVRRADDPEGAADLARLVHGIATATHRRRLRSAIPDRQPMTL